MKERKIKGEGKTRRAKPRKGERAKSTRVKKEKQTRERVAELYLETAANGWILELPGHEVQTVPMEQRW